MQLKYGPYSPSRLETAVCGYNFFRQYIDENRPPRTEGLAQARGSALHEVFEKITPLIAKGYQEISDGQVRQWVAEAIQRHPAAYEETGLILDMVSKYLACPPLLEPDAEVEKLIGIKLTENGFEQCDYNDPEAYARGRADIMMLDANGDVATIIDHKTQPNIEDADTFQMGFYAWVLKKTYPFLKEIRTVLHFARYGKYSPEFVWTEERLAAVESEILTRISVVEGRTSWEATPNRLCQYCQFKSECPALSGVVERTPDGHVRPKPESLKILGDTYQAARLAGVVGVLEDVVGEIKDELKTHVKQSNSPVASADRVFDFFPTEGVDWDKVNKHLKVQVYEVFEKHGVDPRNYMSFGQTASRSVWMLGNKDLLEELSFVLPKKVATEFRGKLVKREY